MDGYEGIREDDDKRVHFVIVGMSKMGVAMGVQTLYQAHYLNFAKQRTRITFIDTNADKEMAFFKGRYTTLFELMRHRYMDANQTTDVVWHDPMASKDNRWSHLSDNGNNFIDTEVEFVKGELESDGVRAYLRQIAEDKQSKLTIAICLDFTNRALAASLYMPLEVYQSAQLQDIWIYQREVVDIVANLTDEQVASTSVRYKKLRPFGMLYSDNKDNQTAYLKALLVNTAYDVIYNDLPWPKDIADTTDKGWQIACSSWDRLMVNKKWSNYFLLDTMYQKLRGIYMPEALCKLLHSSDDALVTSQQLHEAAMIGTYNDEMFADADWQTKIEQAIEKNMQALMISEHNRWNMQQLMMGVSPCLKPDDDMLRQLIQDMTLAKKEGRMQDYKQAEAEQKNLKNMLKRSTDNVHPNICDFDHLKVTDPGAGDYDLQLTRAIPRILMMVDGYGMCQYQSKD